MLTIRMQRTGRKGHAMFRVVVQDSRQAPTSGKVVARLGSYDPHAKAAVLDKEKAAFYLEHGAQPSDRAARLLKNEGVKLPGWVKEPAKKERAVRNPDKRRSTAPAQPAEESAPAESAAGETPAEPTADQTSSESPVAQETLAEAAETEAAETGAAGTEAKPEPETETAAADDTVTGSEAGSEADSGPDAADQPAA